MKLLFCFECYDIKPLRSQQISCACGKVAGKYVDDINATYQGPGCLIGIANSSFVKAVKAFKKDRGNHQFDAFTIPDKAPTVKKLG